MFALKPRVSVLFRVGVFTKRGLSTVCPLGTQPASRSSQHVQATHEDALRIPVIDFSKFRSASTSAEREHTAQQVVSAFKDSGFVYLAGHGIPAAAVQDAFEKVRPLRTVCVVML